MNKENSKIVDSRLASIEGHIKGIRKMVEEGKECTDILLQISAIESSIKKVGKLILKNHLEHCVIDAIKNDDESLIKELSILLEKYI